MSLKRMWFGTKDFGEFIEAPARNADISPKGYSSETDLLSGGAAVRTSRYSHKIYQYEWPQSSSDLMAQKMKDYSDGVYGLGMIHHLDPNSMRKNAAEARWGAPFLTAIDAPPLHPDVRPSLVATPANAMGFPLMSAFHDLSSITAATEPPGSTFIPVPPGYKANIFVKGTRGGTGVVYVKPVLLSGADGTAVAVIPSSVANMNVSTSVSGATNRGFRIYPGKTAAGGSQLTLSGVMVQIVPVASTGLPTGWIGGMGHSGCEIVGKPSFLQYSGIAGGQAKFDVRLVEVGAWLLA